MFFEFILRRPAFESLYPPALLAASTLPPRIIPEGVVLTGIEERGAPAVELEAEPGAGLSRNVSSRYFLFLSLNRL